MMYTAKVAVCSQVRTKHSTQSEHHVEFLNVKLGGTYRYRYALRITEATDFHLTKHWPCVITDRQPVQLVTAK
jgi:hypothetical protein